MNKTQHLNLGDVQKTRANPHPGFVFIIGLAWRWNCLPAWDKP